MYQDVIIIPFHCKALRAVYVFVHSLRMFLSFKPFQSHNRLTRICDISSDPTLIHEIWKQLLEGTILQRHCTSTKEVECMKYGELISFISLF